MKVTCETCGLEFNKRPSAIKKTAHNFCGFGCMGKWNSVHRKGEDHPNYKHGQSKGSMMECLYCGEEQKRGRHFQKYCNSSCQLNYEYKHGLRDKKNTTKKAREVSHAKMKEHNWLQDKENRDKILEIQQTQEYKEKISIANSGEKNGMYGKTPWNKMSPTKKWWEEKEFVALRKECLEKYDHKCANPECQVTDKETDLYCDHIIPYRIMKEHKADNLWMLCGSCHSSKTGRVDMKLFDMCGFLPGGLK